MSASATRSGCMTARSRAGHDIVQASSSVIDSHCSIVSHMAVIPYVRSPIMKLSPSSLSGHILRHAESCSDFSCVAASFLERSASS